MGPKDAKDIGASLAGSPPEAGEAARGASYEALLPYAMPVLPGRAAAGSVEEFRGLVRAGCRGLDGERAEELVGGVLFYCAAATPG